MAGGGEMPYLVQAPTPGPRSLAVTATCAQPMVMRSMMRIRVSRAGRCGAAGLSRYHTRARARG